MMKRQILLGAVILFLVGCQQLQHKRSEYVRDHEQDYLKVSLLPPLKTPNDLSTPSPVDNYPLPEHLPAPEKLEPVSLIPPGFDLN